MNWWQLDIPEVLGNLNSSEDGLTDDVAKSKLSEVGPNELIEKKRKSTLAIFLDQFKDFMIIVLLAAAIVAGIAGDLTDTFIIIVIVILNAIVGFVQENKAERAMEALKKISALQAHVRRSGKVVTIPAAELVPGDVIELDAGNVVPADIRLIEAHSLKINESALTGESVPVEKTAKKLSQTELSLGDRLNMAYKSTLVSNGRGRAIVVATGMSTEIGAIAKMLQQPEEVTPLQKRMADFGRKLSYLVILICVLFFVVGYLRKEDPINMLLTSISLAVAAIPEALPALITVTLAAGAKRLVKKNALIRKLSAVETLGSVTFICSDKTGTLTQNKMKVVKSEDAGSDVLKNTLSAYECCIALNHDVKVSSDKLTGDPTEIALIEYFIGRHSQDRLFELADQFARVAELPFDSERKLMTTVHRFGNQFLITCKGAVESLISTLKSQDNSPQILDRANEFARDGIRVIAFGYKVVDSLPGPFTTETIEENLIFAGLTGMIDPPREEAKTAIDECKGAGITTVMITGDHPETAAAIARQIGILSQNDLVVTGKELQMLSDGEFAEKVEKIRVYARVSPAQKLRIVKALQDKKNFVSMTGDGVNDAPSLKASDIGIAMGITGTDVSKEAADMILLDDNFATIVKAVKEGRHIYDNIRNLLVHYDLQQRKSGPCFRSVGRHRYHIQYISLWINLVTDGLPGLALEVKAEPDIVKRAKKNR
jgi:Ca2+-transporting ATPase